MGSEPVLLHDHRFQFVVDLDTGATVGEVFLETRIDGPRSIGCRLDIADAGLTPEGDAMVTYTGSCRLAPVGSADATR